MNEHLSSETLTALVDGELGPDQLAAANRHLAGCPSCTSSALHHSLLKSTTAKAGQRHAPSIDLQQKLKHQIRRETALAEIASGRDALARQRRSLYGWAAASALLLIVASVVLVQSLNRRSISPEYAALATEVCDQHIAALAANSPPQVISSDRHTVKPWFQGKLPFSFNLPENLPAGTVLDGANLTYLGGQPTAQLLYKIGNHHVSVFIHEQRESKARDLSLETSGFHIKTFTTGDLAWVAVSDVDPARLSDLVGIIENAQASSH